MFFMKLGCSVLGLFSKISTVLLAGKPSKTNVNSQSIMAPWGEILFTLHKPWGIGDPNSTTQKYQNVLTHCMNFGKEQRNEEYNLTIGMSTVDIGKGRRGWK